MQRISAILLAIPFFACSGGNNQAGPTSPRLDPNAPAPEQVVVLFEALADDVDDARSDCGRVATLLSRWTEIHRQDYPELDQRSATSELSDDARSAHENRLRASLTTIVDVVTGCQNDPRTQAAFTQFDVLVDPQ